MIGVIVKSTLMLDFHPIESSSFLLTPHISDISIKLSRRHLGYFSILFLFFEITEKNKAVIVKSPLVTIVNHLDEWVCLISTHESNFLIFTNACVNQNFFHSKVLLLPPPHHYCLSIKFIKASSLPITIEIDFFRLCMSAHSRVNSNFAINSKLFANRLVFTILMSLGRLAEVKSPLTSASILIFRLLFLSLMSVGLVLECSLLKILACRSLWLEDDFGALLFEVKGSCLYGGFDLSFGCCLLVFRHFARLRRARPHNNLVKIRLRRIFGRGLY